MSQAFIWSGVPPLGYFLACLRNSKTSWEALTKKIYAILLYSFVVVVGWVFSLVCFLILFLFAGVFGGEEGLFVWGFGLFLNGRGSQPLGFGINFSPIFSLPSPANIFCNTGHWEHCHWFQSGKDHTLTASNFTGPKQHYMITALE